MYLKRLELQGFKSFADKTVLEFKSGITSVIGPNGSGKSNISDAIRWVLGEQSMKSLRGSKSEDVIFAGTQARKSLGFAEVSMIIDNTDGRLPIEYSEVTVTRKIYRSGETGYFINKTPCRLKDVLELFMDTGIGKDGYSIIGQGKIDEILSNKSEDRRKIFEEAAGIVKYRTRKEESEKKLEQTKLNLLRINDILTEIESNIEPLKLQADKAKKYLDLREELKNIEVGLFLYNISEYKEKLEKIVGDIQIVEDQNTSENDKMQKLQEAKEKLKHEIDDITAKIEAMQSLSFESTNRIEKINSEIGISKERIQNNNINIERLTNEIKEIKQRNIELEEEQKQKLTKKEDLASNREKFQKELDDKQRELEELTKKLSDKELEIEAKKQKIEQNTDRKYEITSEISSIDANLENIDKREKVANSEIESLTIEIDGVRNQKQEMSKAFYEVESKKNELANRLKEKSNKKETSMQKIKEFDTILNNLAYETNMKDSRLKFLIETEREKEGYTRSVKSLLTACEKDNKLNKGINGVLANLISVDKKYEIAIEMCLGQTLQNIVTDTEEDAKKLVEYLRINNLGRASFLPVSSVKGKKLDRIIKNSTEGVIGVASDLVKCDKKYEQIVLNLLGRTLIVENMDTAIQMAKLNSYSFRIVTLEGDIISSTGSITGGSIQTKTVNILGRNREIEELEKTLKELKEKKERITKEKAEYTESVADVIEEVTRIEKELQDIEVVYATENQKILNVGDSIAKLETRREKLKHEVEELIKQRIDSNTNKEAKQEEIKALSKEIEDLNKVVEEFALKNKDNQKYIDDLNFDITNLKISVNSFDESGSSIDEIVERIKQDIENNKQSIANKEENINIANVEKVALENKIVDLEEQINKINLEVENSSNIIEKLKANRVESNEKLKKSEQDISLQFNTIEDIKGQLVKLDVRKTKLEQDLEQVVNNLWVEYELTPNNAEGYKKPENVQKAARDVNSMRTQIKELGSINVDSIEEYKKTKERYEFMCEQRLDLENTIVKLRSIISEMTQTMKEQFTEKFNEINKNFNEVFTELFGGGKAELKLEDKNNVLECGIDIHVQPTGKKLQNMMLLSGGEKAFTAIALLFAILKINPAPFCVLDEIEAALDDVNVYRFAEYLKKFSKETQFLVITHRKGTMEAANTVYGVTMEENGVSKLLSMKLG